MSCAIQVGNQTGTFTLSDNAKVTVTAGKRNSSSFEVSQYAVFCGGPFKMSGNSVLDITSSTDSTGATPKALVVAIWCDETEGLSVADKAKIIADGKLLGMKDTNNSPNYVEAGVLGTADNPINYDDTKMTAVTDQSGLLISLTPKVDGKQEASAPIPVPTVVVDESLTGKWFKAGETVTVSGTVTDNSGNGIKSVTIAGIGEAPVSATVTRQGETAVYDWTYTYSSAADTKETQLTVNATGKDELVGTETFTLRVDTAAPTITVTRSSDGYVSGTGEATVYWYQKDASVTTKAVVTDATSDLASVTYNGADYTSGTDKALDTASESESNRSAAFAAADNAGNSASDSFAYNVDGTEPDVGSIYTSDFQADSVHVDDNYHVWVKQNDTLSVNVEITDNKSGLASASAAAVRDGAGTVLYADGKFVNLDTAVDCAWGTRYNITATDNVGNVNTDATLKYGVDGTAPVITDNAPDLVNNAETLTFVLTAEDTGSGVQKAEYQIDGGDWTEYTPGSELVIETNCILVFRFTDNVGNESTKTYTIENLIRILGADGNPITDEAAKAKATSCIKELSELIDSLSSYNGDGKNSASNPSIVSALGSKGRVKLLVKSLAFNDNAADAGDSFEISEIYFDITAIDSNGAEQHRLPSSVSFKLPIPRTNYKYALIYHEGKLLETYEISNLRSIEIKTKSFSEFCCKFANSIDTPSSIRTITAYNSLNGSISVSKTVGVPDETITILVKPDSGYELNTLKVTTLGGAELAVTTVKAGSTYTFTMIDGAVIVEATFKAVQIVRNNPFADVAESDYFFEPVLWAAEKAITSGVDDTHFAPAAKTTRAQMVTFLWRAAGSPTARNRVCPFTDVTSGSYYYEAVLWAVEKGITTGTSDTTFSPNDAVTRAQAVTFLWRYEGMPKAEADSSFRDVSEDAYYAEAVSWAKAQGITDGVTPKTFAPNATCTRAQIVTFLYRDMAK